MNLRTHRAVFKNRTGLDNECRPLPAATHKSQHESHRSAAPALRRRRARSAGESGRKAELSSRDENSDSAWPSRGFPFDDHGAQAFASAVHSPAIPAAGPPPTMQIIEIGCLRSVRIRIVSHSGQGGLWRRVPIRKKDTRKYFRPRPSDQIRPRTSGSDWANSTINPLIGELDCARGIHAAP